MKTALIICTYNRPEYLKRCLASVEALDEKPDEIIIVDDKSTDTGVRTLFMNSHLPMTIIHKYRKSDIKGSLLKGFNYAFNEYEYNLAINLDSDAIVKPDFITRLKDLKARFHEHIISGFNCNHPINPIISEGEDYVMRKHCNGINMAIDKHQYHGIIKPSLLRESGNWDRDSSHDKPFVISKPSVVEHIGMVSSMGHSVNPDVSCDFES